MLWGGKIVKNKKVKSFLANGIKTWRAALGNRYNVQSKEVKDMRRELFSAPSGRAADANQLRHDWSMVSRDVRVSFGKLVLNNG